MISSSLRGRAGFKLVTGTGVCDNRAKGRRLGVAAERHSAGSHFVEDYPIAEYIAPPIEVFPAGLLGGDMYATVPIAMPGLVRSLASIATVGLSSRDAGPAPSASGASDKIDIAVVDPGRFRQAEIQDLCLPAGRDENFLGRVFLDELSAQNMWLLDPTNRESAARVIRIPADFTSRVLRRSEPGAIPQATISEEADAALIEVRLVRALIAMNGHLLEAATATNPPER